ncbi:MULTISPECIES: photosynthetic reaction center cytochrome PufC [unclassified Sphingomonas]|jgi:photosynthetic reaction center cytochrome c subunit|uniref:photosynthetic reaction center cytochrome PufC n=2 Tax=unclassified Sphingomonas TaxID=196159 RepID=UPI0008328AD7|nr:MULTISPECIES: photosynthetic reaction center cytochrome PufC [unclassified Sphingomonas]
MSSSMRLYATLAAGAGLSLALGACDLGPKKITQTGYRGTGMAQVVDVNNVKPAAVIPDDPYPLPADEGPSAAETYQNVQVLGDLSAERFNHLMAQITQWVAPPEQGCNYCHNPENLASDEKYTKNVARQMLVMTRSINTNWQSHVKETGVTCYTCHRGNAIPAYVWASGDNPSGGIRGNKRGQNTPAAQVGYASLPYDPYSMYLQGDQNSRVNNTGIYPVAVGKSVKQAEASYAIMMHLSTALGVNCTFCHNTDSFQSWSNSRPQRALAWYGIRMVREINNQHLNPLAPIMPANRKGPNGDSLKVNCLTCHQGVNKPLGGVSMLPSAPTLRVTPALLERYKGYVAGSTPMAEAAPAAPPTEPATDSAVAEAPADAAPAEAPAATE